MTMTDNDYDHGDHSDHGDHGDHGDDVDDGDDNYFYFNDVLPLFTGFVQVHFSTA